MVSKRLCAGVEPSLGADFVGFAPRRMSQFAWAYAGEVGQRRAYAELLLLSSKFVLNLGFTWAYLLGQNSN